MKSVPQEIIDQAENCPFEYACITNSDHEHCGNRFIKPDNLTAIAPKAETINIENHPYFISLPYSKVYYCICPAYDYLNK